MTTEEFYKRELATGHLGPKPPSGKAGEIGSRGMRDYVRGLANVTLGELGSGSGNGAKGRLVMPKWETKEQCIVLILQLLITILGKRNSQKITYA